jgi:hypothetical protein
MPPKKVPILFGALFLICAVSPLAAQIEVDLHGSVESLHALPFSRDRDLTESRSVFNGELGLFAGEASAFVSLSAEYNGISPDRRGFSLGEAWMDWSRGGLSVRLGRQLLSWGTAAGLILTDLVCPQNLSAYAGLDFAGSRLPVNGLRLRYSFSALALEALWLPLFTPARLPEDPENPLYPVLYPPAADGMALSVSMAPLPRALVDGEYGLRVSAYTRALDFSFMGFYGWNDVPYTSKQPVPHPAGGLQIIPGYGRTLTAGADASIPLGEILLRLETAWTGGGRYDPPLAETTAALSGGQRVDPVVKHNLKFLAGLDWNPSPWNLSVQYYEDLLPGARNGGTERPWRENGLTLQAARNFFRETLGISFWCYLNLQDFDSAGSVSAAYALTDSLSFSLGSNFFTGGIAGRGSYNAYRDLSSLWIKAVYLF